MPKATSLEKRIDFSQGKLKKGVLKESTIIIDLGNNRIKRIVTEKCGFFHSAYSAHLKSCWLPFWPTMGYSDNLMLKPSDCTDVQATCCFPWSNLMISLFRCWHIIPNRAEYLRSSWLSVSYFYSYIQLCIFRISCLSILKR